MIDDTNIQVAELCTLQFREPRDYQMYPEQVERYCPKIVDQELKVQVLISSALHSADNLYLRIYNENDVKITEKKFTVATLGTYYYATATFTDVEIAAIAENTVCYFAIETNNAVTVYATSVWYTINPAYTDDLKQITFTNSTNDWNVIFGSGTLFTITLECGFIPLDSTDEQETEDFIEQNMVNETVFGDEYEVLGFTLGDSVGIPNWLRKKISRASLCSTFKIDGVEYTRAQGSKMEKVTDTYNGLAVYRINLQTTKNYLQ